MKKEHNGPYKLIAEWEKPQSVALVYPGKISKYNINPFNKTESQFGMKDVIEDFNVIVNHLIPLKKTDNLPGIDIIVAEQIAAAIKEAKLEII